MTRQTSETRTRSITEPRDLVRSVQRASLLLDAIARAPAPPTAAELALAAGLNVSTVHHLLNTLEVESIVTRGDDRRYRLGPQILFLASTVPAAVLEHPGVVAELDELHARSRETTYVCAWQGGEIVVLAVRPGLVPVVVGGLGVGYRQHSHGATAKAILAFSEPERVERYLGSRQVSIVDREAFDAELGLIRERGFALDDGRFAEGVTCASAPILAAVGNAIGALSIAVPSERFHISADALIPELAAAGRRASAHLGYSSVGVRAISAPESADPAV
jgi:DNA-binding IclR family transcriptional regulator